MIQSWSAAAEEILAAAANGKARVIGVTSPDGAAGVSLIARSLADSASAAGVRTLFVDLSQPASSDRTASWTPLFGAGEAVAVGAGGCDLLVARPKPTNRALFNNPAAFKKLFSSDLGGYELVIVDLPAVLDGELLRINPRAAASACDSIVLVCVAGYTTQGRTQAAISELEAAGAVVGGTVLNDPNHALLARKLARSAQRLSVVSRRLSGAIERAIKRSELLN